MSKFAYRMKFKADWIDARGYLSSTVVTVTAADSDEGHTIASRVINEVIPRRDRQMGAEIEVGRSPLSIDATHLQANS